MNTVNLIGRLVKDPVIRSKEGESSITVARYTLAVDRKFKKEGHDSADFIPCTSFGAVAEFAEKYLHKGMKIGIEGTLHSGKYVNKEGKIVFTMSVIVNSHSFCDSRKDTGTLEEGENENVPFTTAYDEELPF